MMPITKSWTLKDELIRFNRCGCCGSDHSAFDLIKTPAPGEVSKTKYTIQCTYCGREMTHVWMDELIYKWNRYGYDGDVYPDPSKKAKGNEVLREANEKLREENKALKARIKELEDENLRYWRKLTAMPEPSGCSGIENLSPDELLELSRRIKDAEEGYRTMESKRWADEHDSREALRLSEQGCQSLEECMKLDYYITTGVLSRARKCLDNAAKREAEKRKKAYKAVDDAHFIYGI